MALLSSSIGRFRVLKGWLPSRRPAGYPSRISRESFVVAPIFLVLGIRGGLGMRSGGMMRTIKKGIGFCDADFLGSISFGSFLSSRPPSHLHCLHSRQNNHLN